METEVGAGGRGKVLSVLVIFMFDDIYNYTTSYLGNKGIKYEINTFDSGCKMIDIWDNKEFYCIQIEEGFVGFSHIKTVADGFGGAPDFKFTDLASFKSHFEMVLGPVI